MCFKTGCTYRRLITLTAKVREVMDFFIEMQLELANIYRRVVINEVAFHFDCNKSLNIAKSKWLYVNVDKVRISYWSYSLSICLIRWSTNIYTMIFHTFEYIFFFFCNFVCISVHIHRTIALNRIFIYCMFREVSLCSKV
jgi:hypothetical protein